VQEDVLVGGQRSGDEDAQERRVVQPDEGADGPETSGMTASLSPAAATSRLCSALPTEGPSTARRRRRRASRVIASRPAADRQPGRFSTWRLSRPHGHHDPVDRCDGSGFVSKRRAMTTPPTRRSRNARLSGCTKSSQTSSVGTIEVSPTGGHRPGSLRARLPLSGDDGALTRGGLGGADLSRPLP
jgi:hypothetical protein